MVRNTIDSDNDRERPRVFPPSGAAAYGPRKRRAAAVETLEPVSTPSAPDVTVGSDLAPLHRGAHCAQPSVAVKPSRGTKPTGSEGTQHVRSVRQTCAGGEVSRIVRTESSSAA